MEDEDVFRHFSDITKFDPALSFSNKLTELIKDPNRKIETRLIFKLIKNLSTSKNPRLYSSLVKQCILRLNQTVIWKDELIKNIIFFFTSLVNLEKYLYSRFDTVQEMMKILMSRKSELSQIDMIKILEATTQLKQTGGLIMAASMQSLLDKNIKNIIN